MTTSQKTPFLFEISDQEAVIPEGKLEYLRERLRNELYHFILSKFFERTQTHRLTKAKLARRIDCDPGQLNRLLGAPGNWTISTVSDLLVGIASEELIPNSRSLVDRTPRNYQGLDWLQTSTTSLDLAFKQIPMKTLEWDTRETDANRGSSKSRVTIEVRY